MTSYAILSTKGGQGATTFAAALALQLAHDGDDVIIAGHDGDMAAMFGCSANDCWQLTDRISHRPAECAPEMNAIHVVYVGDAAWTAQPDATSVLVVRPCYLALRNAVADERVIEVDGYVLFDEPKRALGASDVSNVLGLPCLATVPVREEIARAIDAGVLAMRTPDALVAAARGVIGATRGEVAA